MSSVSNRLLAVASPLLAVLALFNLWLTLYACSQFYLYLPSSDTWIYVDFLAKSAQGQLEIASLFERHNQTHLIALPKLVYFFDVWLTRGSGWLVVLASLSALVTSAAIFIAAVYRSEKLQRKEKRLFALFGVSVLVSASQVESLLNPANLQWSLMVAGAFITAWFVYRSDEEKKWPNKAGLLAGIFFLALTSASILFALIPLVLMNTGRRVAQQAAWLILGLSVVAIAAVFFWQGENGLSISELYQRWLKFTIDFMVPPVERLHTGFISYFTLFLVLAALWYFSRLPADYLQGIARFFYFLLLFSLLVIASTGVVRSHSETAFTFRFVNVGLLFSLAALSMVYLLETSHRAIAIVLMATYAVLLTFVSVREASAFGYGRNHYRLNQIAYGLEIKDPYVVVSMPGTIWQEQEYQFVSNNHYKLKEAGIGIYSDPHYQQVGRSIKAISAGAQLLPCETRVLKVRHLQTAQAAYKITGQSRSAEGERLTRVLFTDKEGIVRGLALPVMSSKQLLQDLWQGKQWAGFVNMEAASSQQEVLAYAYEGSRLCEATSIRLPPP